jgi:hypothetical protein
MKYYQESYNKAFNLGGCYNGEEQEQGRDELQELVDLRNPMKVSNVKLEGLFNVGKCVCGMEVHQYYNHDNCGECSRALDWSNHND